jgi:hypothetical protein
MKKDVESAALSSRWCPGMHFNGLLYTTKKKREEIRCLAETEI